MANPHAEELSTLYYTLDSLIEHQSEIIAQKKNRIQTITDGMNSLSLTPEQLFSLNNRLYDEYLAFNFDSALCYIKKNVDVQQSLGNPGLAAGSLIRMAHILAVSGLFDKADRMLDQIDISQLSTECKVEYYNQRGELNLYRSEMAEYTPYFQEYTDSSQYYRQLILEIAPKDSYDYIFNQATYISEKGDNDGAIKMLEAYMKNLKQGERRYSIVTSTLAYFYSKKDEAQLQERYFLLSAISDMKGAILENNSLRRLSIILLDRGDFKKAYEYLLCASNDARQYGSRLRSMQAARISPLITQAYDMERALTQHRTNLLLIILSVITLLLIGTVVYILSLIKKRHQANIKISKMNAELSLHNEEIERMNNQMKESNRIKDEYIGRFLELSSNLILKNEERSKVLNRLARDRKLELLYGELKSQKPLNESVHLFHQNFDTAFLNIYPTFISEVNQLLTEDNQFEVHEEAGKLTTELRILALIRLNITDNQKIADILRSSITTIYTYRSKLKSRAKSKATFEDDVRRIETY
jgi:cell division protein FtsL